MVKVDDMDRIGEMQGSDVPYPMSPVAQNDDQFRMGETAYQRLGVETLTTMPPRSRSLPYTWSIPLPARETPPTSSLSG